MPAIAFLIGLLALGIAEIYVFVQVAHAITGLGALALLVLSMVLGGRLVGVEGRRTLRHIQAAGARGSLPASELVDGALVAVGGLLLVVPGFITTVVGLVLVLPLTRPLVKLIALRTVGKRFARAVVVRVNGSSRFGGPGFRGAGSRGAGSRGAGTVIDGDVVDAEVVEVAPPDAPRLPL